MNLFISEFRKFRDLIDLITKYRKLWHYSEVWSPSCVPNKQPQVSDKSIAELAQTSRHNELLLAAVGEGIYGLDCNGMTTFVNPASARMLGYQEHELLGKPMHALLHHTKPDGSDFPKEECSIYAAFVDGAVRQVDDEVFWRKDGSSFPVEYTSTPILEDGKLNGAVVVFRDITKRKQTETTLHQFMRKNELILTAVGEGIYGIGEDGLATFVNPAAVEMTGWTEQDILGKSIHEMHHHTKSDGSPYPREECPIYSTKKDGTVHHADDEVFWRKDGSSFPVEYTSTPIFEDGELVGAVAVFKDITERKKTERQLHEAYTEVERMKHQLEAENTYLQEEINVEHDFAGLVGQSAAIQQVLSQVDLVAPTDASVLITGESGTGKELIARAIHERSDRHARPMIRVNCAAIPKELFESEFFGHIKGAFTGAIKDRTGRFELADGGTIFLDEVGEIPLELQSKLLRVLQEGQIERVGEEKTRNINVRVIAATNRNLKADSEAKLFREDLYFRLNVFPVEVVPLRARSSDIPLLAAHFIALLCKRYNRAEPLLTQANVAQLQAYHWPGNVRELQNIMERAVIVVTNGKLEFDLPGKSSVPVIDTKIVVSEFNTAQPFDEEERLARDRGNIIAALKMTDGKVSGKQGAAELLGIKSTTLISRMNSLGIEKPGK
jgi:PAS domain S-box-containing protein